MKAYYLGWKTCQTIFYKNYLVYFNRVIKVGSTKSTKVLVRFHDYPGVHDRASIKESPQKSHLMYA